MNAVTALQCSYDGLIPADEMARAIAQDAGRAADPDATHASDIAMFRAEIAHYRGRVLSKVAEARTGATPYSRDGIKTHLRTLRQRQAQLRALQVAA